MDLLHRFGGLSPDSSTIPHLDFIIRHSINESIQKLKGKTRPVNPENERAEVLAALACVDIVSIFNEATAEKFLDLVKPDIYVKGGEYNLEELPEAVLVRSFGGKTIEIPMIPGFSTTKLIERLKKI